MAAHRDEKLCTQNSGVHVPGADDISDIDFYGKLIGVVQLLYKDRCQVILFKCHWFDHRDLPRYNAPERANDDVDVPTDEEEWESESDESDDIYSSSNED